MPAWECNLCNRLLLHPAREATYVTKGARDDPDGKAVCLRHVGRDEFNATVPQRGREGGVAAEAVQRGNYRLPVGQIKAKSLTGVRLASPRQSAAKPGIKLVRWFYLAGFRR
jgi:hypothetical protein